MSAKQENFVIPITRDTICGAGNKLDKLLVHAEESASSAFCAWRLAGRLTSDKLAIAGCAKVKAIIIEASDPLK